MLKECNFSDKFDSEPVERECIYHYHLDVKKTKDGSVREPRQVARCGRSTYLVLLVEDCRSCARGSGSGSVSVSGNVLVLVS